ncbi:uncharacterized protein LOC132034606 [Lycium ferocissimum]|uniref:uncharacterized protein LOC132034606 n=1 Tax=Lycium ferocissimum TaxID=112874 RepID=UPI002815CCB9|nr:uncharacterized protein LOC132034606 [Lycium ferocissimum]
MNQIAVNTAAGGCFMDKSFVNITNLLDKLTTHNQAWNSNDTESLPYGSPSLAAVAKENHERDHAFAQLQTTVDILSKKLAEKDAKGVNVVEEMPPTPPWMYQVPEGMYQKRQQHYKDANYVNNSKRGYQRQNYQAAIQKLELQFRYLLREVHTPQYGQIPSDTIPNSKGSGVNSLEHIAAISTRSGKILQGADKKVIDLEPIVEEEAQPNVSDVIVEDETEGEIPIIAKEEQSLENPKAQGGKNEKGKAKLSGALRPLTQLFKSSPPFPQRLVRKTEDEKCLRFYDQLKQLTMNIPFMDVVQEMPGFAKYLKDLLTKKKKPLKHDTVGITHRVSAIISKTTV